MRWIFTVLFISVSAAASPDHSVDPQVWVRRGLEGLAVLQVQHGREPDRFVGEWPSTMVHLESMAFMGFKGDEAYDSNCFATASIHQTLGDISLRSPEYRSLTLPMMELARPLIERYRNGSAFNFWLELPRPENLIEPGKSTRDYPLTRRPNHYPFYHEFVLLGSNPVNDADDTALSLMALHNQEQLVEQIESENLATPESPSESFPPLLRPETPLPTADRIGALFAQWRDLGRKNVHFINLINGRYLNTGAFMTWLAPEKDYSIHPYHGTTDPWIPFGQNDVDCVVNANVLSALAQFGALDTPGVSEACQWIDEIARKKEYSICGVYYPNRYNLHYVTAKAYTKGVTCLAPAVQKMTQDLIDTQRSDGSWSTPDLDRGDVTQSSAYAFNALVRLVSSEIMQQRGRLILPAQSKESIENGLSSLLRAARQNPDKTQAIWPRGVFFTGGSVVRKKLAWMSEAYTTAIVVDALEMASHLPKISP